jgi:hypothetical protein
VHYLVSTVLLIVGVIHLLPLFGVLAGVLGGPD